MSLFGKPYKFKPMKYSGKQLKKYVTHVLQII